jgi:hypothetical protein
MIIFCWDIYEYCQYVLYRFWKLKLPNIGKHTENDASMMWDVKRQKMFFNSKAPPRPAHSANPVGNPWVFEIFKGGFLKSLAWSPYQVVLHHDSFNTILLDYYNRFTILLVVSIPFYWDAPIGLIIWIPNL